MNRQHHYEVQIKWTGNRGSGTSAYSSYGRDHMIAAAGKPAIPGSSDPAFRGDLARYNPEDLLVASLSACHMLWYLHLCAANHIVVVEYQDNAQGTMAEKPDGSGVFVDVTLRPQVKIAADADESKALALHEQAHRYCFIANSVNFPVHHVPQITKQGNFAMDSR
jgi:organic hydroperoxide reductase OsmC/OhrA